jgi:hypothetical protein
MAALHACISHMYEWGGAKEIVDSKFSQCVQQGFKEARVREMALRTSVQEAEESRDRILQGYKENAVLVLNDLFNPSVPMEQIVQSAEFKQQLEMAGQSQAQRIEEATRKLTSEHQARLSHAAMLTTAELRRRDEEVTELRAQLHEHAKPLQIARDATETLSHMETLRRRGIETYTINGQEMLIDQAIAIYKGKSNRKRAADEQPDAAEGRVLRARLG